MPNSMEQSRKTKYYTQVQHLIEALIAFPETGRDEDAMLRVMHNQFTQMIGKQSGQTEEPVPQPTPEMFEEPAQQAPVGQPAPELFNKGFEGIAENPDIQAEIMQAVGGRQ